MANEEGTRITTDDEMVTWTCYQWPRQCGHRCDVDCMATEEAIKQRLETFEVPDA